MREIKFRAWNKEWDMMIQSEIYGYGIDEAGIHKISWINTTTDGVEHKEAWENPDDFILMQYTGLKDKNGVEIYEGDIVENNEIKWIIDWLEGCVYLKQVDKENNKWWIGGEYQYCEVIGNIYQNSELLK